MSSAIQSQAVARVSNVQRTLVYFKLFSRFLTLLCLWITSGAWGGHFYAKVFCRLMQRRRARGESVRSKTIKILGVAVLQSVNLLLLRPYLLSISAG